MRKSSSPAVGKIAGAKPSRRHVLALALAGWSWCPSARAAMDGGDPVRLAISESLVSDVNMNDARAAMLIWLKRMTTEMNLVVEIKPAVFDTTEEIVRRTRGGELDAVALNVLEYRRIADLLDPTHIVAEGGASGPEQYVILAKRSSGIQRLGDLRGRKLCVLKTAKMCVAGAWLAAILDEGHFGPAELFFSSMAADSKASRVVLPVFFGQTDACLTTKRTFETMCELNPQVAKDLTVIAGSAPMMLTFYIFHKNYHGVSRERFAKAYAELPNSVAGRQLATLFQFESLEVKDIACLAPALAVLEASDRAHARRGTGGRKG
jgi:phosphonate transport system substrate-binding protein